MKDEEKRTKSTFLNPVFETLINKAVFINQDITVYPDDIICPHHLTDVVKFLFGEGAYVKQDVINNKSCLIIKGATFVLSDVKTLNADWIIKKIEE